MASVNFTQVSKRFAKTKVLHDVTLKIEDREFLVLVGPSGCGKSTLLRMLAGLEETTEGEIFIGEKIVNHLPPRSREIAMVFQDYALYPHMTVEENMSFGLRLRRMPKDVIDERVQEAAQILQIEPLLKRRPRQLSGGQRQRVAIGRAIVRKPEVFLFDEPLSNLDAKLREEMRVEIAKLHQRLNATIIYVTHDQVEAMTLATRIAVINKGIIQQVGAPEEVFSRPDNTFVAGFIGSPTMNFIEGRLEKNGSGARFTAESIDLPVPEDRAGKAVGKLDAVLGVRPDNVCLDQGTGGKSAIPAEIDVVELLGNNKNVYLTVAGKKLLAVVGSSFPGRRGEKVSLHVDPKAIHLFDKASGKRL